MAEMVNFISETKNGKFFESWECIRFYAKSYEDGYVEIEPFVGTHLDNFAQFVAGCFAEKSNFKIQMKTAFGKEKDAKFCGIKFNCNGIELNITEEFADKDKIIQLYEAGVKNLSEQERKARKLAKEAYKKSPAYKAIVAKYLKRCYRMEEVRDELLQIAETSKIEFKSDEFKKMFEEFAEINSDPYGSICVKFAERFAKIAQYLMAKHDKSLIDIADNVIAIVSVEGMNGIIFAHAMLMLELCWKHGDRIGEWQSKLREKMETGGTEPVVCIRISLDDEEDDESAE